MMQLSKVLGRALRSLQQRVGLARWSLAIGATAVLLGCVGGTGCAGSQPGESTLATAHKVTLKAEDVAVVACDEADRLAIELSDTAAQADRARLHTAEVCESVASAFASYHAARDSVLHAARMVRECEGSRVPCALESTNLKAAIARLVDATREALEAASQVHSLVAGFSKSDGMLKPDFEGPAKDGGV